MTDSILRSYFNISTSTFVPFVALEPPMTPLFDTYTGAAVGYSLRLLRTGETAAVRIRRSSDNAEQDIGFYNGGFDTASAASFIGGGTGFIVTWYDQSGNGYDATQATASAQPTYTASGIGTVPGMTLDGGDSLVTASITDLTSGTDTAAFFVMYQDSSADQNNVFMWSSGFAFRCYLSYFDVLYFDYGGIRVSASQPSGWDNNPHIVELFHDTSDDQKIIVDGATIATGNANSSSTDTAILTLGYGETFPLIGKLSEMIVWENDIGSTARAAVTTNINTYYGVF